MAAASTVDTVTPAHDTTLPLYKETSTALESIAQRFGVNTSDAVDFLVSSYERIMQLEHDLDVDRSELNARIEQAMERERGAEESWRKVMEADGELRRRIGMSTAVFDLMNDMLMSGASKADIIDWGESLRAAGVDPGKAAQIMRREDVGGLLGWSKRLQESALEAQRTYNELAERNVALKSANEQLTEGMEELTNLYERKGGELIALKSKVELMEAALAEMGAYLNVLRGQGTRIEDLPPMMSRLLAGILLFAGLKQHGKDDVFILKPAPELSRMLPVKVALSEIPYILAPKEAYNAMQQAQAERKAQASVYVRSKIGEGEGKDDRGGVE